MHISCEKCGTTYVLDERLIPATGAPVQCTRCQHVFTAMPPQAEKSASPSASQTMMFGAPGSPGPIPDGPSSSSRPASSTQMFGALAPQSPNPAGGKPAANTTQMFGAVNTGPAPKDSGAPRSTQVFGALSPQAPNAAGGSKPAPNTTQMFGAIAPDGSKGATNIDFGKKPDAGPGRSTMIFGAAGSAPKPGKSDATVRVGPADLERMLKEHRDGQGGRGGEVTPSEGAPAQPDRHNATQLFAMANADSTPNDPAPLEALRRDKTQLFAYSDSSSKPPEDAAAQRRDKTQLFAYSDGEKPPEPAQEPARHNKTQMFALTDNAPTQPQKAQTDEPQEPARHNKTQLFAYGDGDQPLAPVTEPLQAIEANKAPKSKFSPSAPKATMIFGGAADLKTAPPIEPEHEKRELATDPSGADVRPMQLKDHSHNVTFPDLPDVSPESELQPSTLSGDESIPPMAPTEPPGQLDDAALAIAASGRRRTVIALVVVGLLVIALLAAAAYKLYGDRLLAPKVDAQALALLDSEMLKLKADDSPSKASAIKGLSSLVASHPDYVEAHAGLVTAYVLQLDDLQQRAARLEKARNEKNNRVAKYNTEKSPADWVTRANVLVEEVQKMGDDLSAMVSEEKNVDGRLRSAYKQFGDAAQKAGHATVDAQRAALRAQALYQAYGGSDKALAMVNEFRKLGANDGDGWIELVAAEYAVNLGKATEGQYAEALKELEALHARDSTFLRTYPLAARIYLQKGELDRAEAELDKLLVLTQKHDIASQLKDAIKVMRSEKAAKERELKELKEKNEKEAAKP